MRIPAAFHEDRPQVLHDFIRAHPFAVLVAGATTSLEATHAPVEWHDGKLCAHIARNNPLAARDGEAILVVFHGEQGYISPNWYPSKALTHREVPTWNYTAVHVHGRIQVQDDAQWLRDHLARLTDRHEASEPVPWSLADAPMDYCDALVRGLVGLEIRVERMEGQFKLSQNKALPERLGVVEGLRRRGGDNALALASRVVQAMSSADERLG